MKIFNQFKKIIKVKHTMELFTSEFSVLYQFLFIIIQ